MKLHGYPDIDKETFFRNALKPLMEKENITYQYLKNNYFSIKGEEFPWQDGKFDTPSGKYELFSVSAKYMGLSPLPEYIPVREKEENCSLRLLTPHPKNSLHSQHFAFVDNKPAAYINEKTLKQQGFENNQLVKVKSNRGEIEAHLSVSDIVGGNIIMIYEGVWHKSGSVNMLTSDEVSDMGNQAAYYESFCRLEVT